MAERVIASRPSLEQVSAIVDFMEKHPTLAQGRMRGVEGRNESKILWSKLTRIVNGVSGPTRPIKSWVKYWADKKSTVRAKVFSNNDDPSILTSNVEKKIWDLFLAKDSIRKCENDGSSYFEDTRGTVKEESSFIDTNIYEDNDEDMNLNDVSSDSEPALELGTTLTDVEERQNLIMDKLVKVMSDQAASMSQLAHAAQVNAQAMERMAEASQVQARAIDRLATTFEAISGATHDVRSAIIDIDATMKRFYSTSPA